MKLMKNFYLFLSAIAFAVLGITKVQAQLVGSDMYLQGSYLEIGLLPNASFGANAPPAGYHPYPSGTNLAEVYDLGHDGWTVGTPPYNGDYTYPGSPFEGWEIQVAGAQSQAFSPSTTYSGSGTLTGGLTTYSNVGGRIIGNWAGSAASGALVINQETRVDTYASAVVVTVNMQNTGTTALTGIYYMRSCDPDNDEAHGGATYFSTDNTVVFENDADHRVMVDAYGTLYNDHFSLGAKDCRARAFIYTSWPMSSSVDLGTVWDGTYSTVGSGVMDTAKGVLNGDYAMGIVFNIGTLAAGAKTSLSYAYFFNDTSTLTAMGIDSAFPEPQLVVNNVAILPSGPAPAATYDTFNTCSYPGVIDLPVKINYASDKDWTYSTWTWSPSVGLASTTGVTNTINTVALSGETTYTIVGTDSAGGNYSCNYRIMYLTVSPCFHATSNNPCEGDTLWLVGHGDSTAATYQWSGPAGYSSTAQIAFVYPTTMADTGVYRVIKTVAGSNDTVYTDAHIRPLPVVTAGATTPICSQTTLSLTASAFATTGETYQWSGPNVFSSAAQNPTRANAPTIDQGLYKVVTSLNGCKDSSYVEVVIDSTPANPTIGNNSPICSEGDTLMLTASDVTPGVTYSWTGPNSFTSLIENPMILPNVETTYTGNFTVTTTVGSCTNTATTAVTVNLTPSRPVLTTNAPVCTGNTLTLGATSSAGSQFTWNGPDGFYSALATPDILGVTMSAIGVYTVTANLSYSGIPAGCTSDPALMVVNIDSNVTAGFTFTKQYGCMSDTITFTNTSTAATRYLWEFGDGNSGGDADPFHVYYHQAIDTVTLYATAGVCIDSFTQIINMLHPLQAQFSSDSQIVCQSRPISFLDASTATSPMYYWNFGDGTTSALPNPTHTWVNAGVYHVYEVVSDFVPCYDTAFETIYIDSLSPVLISLTDPALCQGTSITVTGNYSGIGNTGITWDLGNGETIKNANPLQFAYTEPGTYTITATALYRVCANATSSVSVVVEPVPQVDLGGDRTICKGSDAITITETDNASNSAASYKWSTGQSGSSISVTDPGTYSVTVTINGCSNSGSVNVTNDCYMSIPNVFTPNGDGLNDYFFPRSLLTSGLTSFSINIYNRWGQLVFTSTSLDGAGWDGKFNGSDQPEGVYVYIIDATFKDGQKEHHQGNVTLLR
jgi:gliding motility-associated-like protein